MSEKQWHHFVREDGSVSLYYTLSGVPAHYVVFDTLDPIPEQRITTLTAERDALAQRVAELEAAVSKARLSLVAGLETEGELEAPYSKADRALIAEIDAVLARKGV